MILLYWKIKVLLASQFLKVFHLYRLRKGNIVFSSFDGKQFSDSPYYVYNFIQDLNVDDFRFFWIDDGSTKEKSKVKSATVLKKGSFAYFKILLSAKYIITNDRLNSYLPIRKRQILVNTWHGGGLFKKTYALSLESRDLRYRVWLNRRDSRRTRLYASSSKMWTERVLRNTFQFNGEVINSGMPRNSKLLSKAYRGVKESLGISDRSKVVLYAPTFRLDYTFDVFDFIKLKKVFEEFLKGECIILYRGHHMARPNLDRKSILDVSNYSDMQELLSISDVLVSDFSSAIWDFSLTLRPIFLFAPDIVKYNSENGFESNYRKWPFPLAEDEAKFLSNVAKFDYEKYQKKVINYHNKLGSYESENSTRILVEKICSL